MEATTITMQDFANLIIVYGFAGLIGVTFGGLLGEGIVQIIKAIIAHRKEKKKKVDAVVE